MNKIVIELCAEDRARLDNILEALKEGAKSSIEKAGESMKAMAESVKQLADTATEVEKIEPKAAEPVEPKETPKEEPKAEPAQTDAPEVTAAELQSKVVNLVRSGKKDEARAIVMEYAENVSAIPAEKRAEVLERLNALEG